MYEMFAMQLQYLAYILILVFAVTTRVEAWPLDGVETAVNSSDIVNATKNATSVEEHPVTAQQSTDLEAAGSEDANNQYVGAIGAVMIPDQSAAATNTFNPDNYEEYINPYGAIPYGPYGAPYPAPIGYAPLQAYPSPYVMQTGTEGYLVPTAVTTSTSDSSSSSSSTSGALTFLTALFPSLMVSTVFRVIAGIISALGVVLFGGAITTAICSFTPLCDITFRAVTYMKRKGTAERVGKIIAEDLTPERVKRATEFVWKAIRKYKELQKSLDESSTT